MFHVPRRAGNHPRRVLAVLILLLILGAGVAAWTTVRPAPRAPVPEATVPARPPLIQVEDLPQLKAQLDRWGASGQFTGGVLVARGDEVLFRQVHGFADREIGSPLELDSKFRLASVSKQFTAAAILRLQDQRVLTIADPVCKWIQPCPEAWATLNLQHLITHTSGIPDLMARPQWGVRRVTPATLDELTADSARYGLQFQPGSEIRYNNAGFNLAAAVVEAAAGKPFDRFLQDEFFTPLGMADTGLGDGPGLVMGYANLAGGVTAQPNANVSIIPGAGALYSTLDDLLVWNRALHGGHLLSAASYAQMIADHAPADRPPPAGAMPRRAWGYGLFVNSLGLRVDPGFGDREIYHTGSWSGFRNLVAYQPEADVTVIVLANNYHQRDAVFLLTQQGMAEALGRPFPIAMRR